MEFPDGLLIDIPRIDFTVHAGLANPAGYKLSVLRAEIENQNSMRSRVIVCGF
jgi:hypothetical protein